MCQALFYALEIYFLTNSLNNLTSKVNFLKWIFQDADPEPGIGVSDLLRKVFQEKPGGKKNRIGRGKKHSRGEISGEVPVHPHPRSSEA